MEEVLKSYLMKDEQIIFEPKQSMIYTKKDFFVILYHFICFLWGILLIYITRNSTCYIFLIIFILYVLFALYITIFGLYEKKFFKQHSIYAITNKRLIYIYKRKFSNKYVLNEKYIGELDINNLEVEKIKNNIGTIKCDKLNSKKLSEKYLFGLLVFFKPIDYCKDIFEYSIDNTWWSGIRIFLFHDNKFRGFYEIENYEDVYKIIGDLKSNS